MSRPEDLARFMGICIGAQEIIDDNIYINLRGSPLIADQGLLGLFRYLVEKGLITFYPEATLVGGGHDKEPRPNNAPSPY